MSKSEVKPREFWIDNRNQGDFFLYNVQRGVMNYNFDGAIHAIEYSAYQSLQKENEELKDEV